MREATKGYGYLFMIAYSTLRTFALVSTYIAMAACILVVTSNFARNVEGAYEIRILLLNL